MKRVIHFSRGYIPAVIASSTLIILGIVGYAVKGFNLGVDFQAGINQTVQIAIPSVEVTYSGKGTATLAVSEKAVTIVYTGAEIDNKTVEVSYASAPTVDAVVAAINAVPDTHAVAKGNGADASALFVPTFQGDTVLGAAPLLITRVPANDSERTATTEKVRAAITGFGDVSVQTINPVERQRYLIRVQDEGKEANFSKSAPQRIEASLEQVFGVGSVVVVKTDYVGPRSSTNTSKTAFWLVLATVLIILVYATIRFRFQYGIGAVLATVHDMLIMICFIVWTRMEFNASTIAAILTILGYSINDTIVQFDRVREDRKLRPNDKFDDVLNTALTETLGRTIITTLCTMITVLALYFFVSGDLKNFALALFVGMISGTYSTIFIASAFVLGWENIAEKKKAKALLAPAPSAPAKKLAPVSAEKKAEKPAAKPAQKEKDKKPKEGK
jgi:preprotein translocase subunit SecF